MAQLTRDLLNTQATGAVSKLQQLWDGGGFAVTVQLPPPLTADARRFIDRVAAQAPHFDAALAVLATTVKLRDEARFLSGASIKVPPALYIGAFGVFDSDDIQEEHMQALSSARFLVTTPVDDPRAFRAALAEFQMSHLDFLSSRPLLVILPLATLAAGSEQTSQEDAAEARKAVLGQITASIKALKGLHGVRGFNIVVSDLADLALLGQIAHRVRSDSAGVGDL
jgi:hypothetical protein